MQSRSASEVGGLIHHLERNLGRIAGGVNAVDEHGGRLPFQIVEYDDAPAARDVVSSTVGLSRHPLAQSSGRPLRLELVVVARREAPARSWLSVLGERMLADGKAVAQGEVTGPVAPVAVGSALTGFYFTAPTYWADDLAAFDGPDGKVLVVWALPVTTSEMSFVQTHGWRAFDELLMSAQPDAADPFRAVIPGVH